MENEGTNWDSVRHWPHEPFGLRSGTFYIFLHGLIGVSVREPEGEDTCLELLIPDVGQQH